MGEPSDESATYTKTSSLQVSDASAFEAGRQQQRLGPCVAGATEIGGRTGADAAQTWLLGYEFPSTLMLFTRSPNKVTFVCSSSKGT
jgi:hypothetical protein